MSWKPEDAKRPECPVCSALVADRRDHHDWHVWIWSVVNDSLARYDKLALDDWVRADPKERRAV